MWQRNDGQDESEILQNHFTAYVMTAIQRRREEYTETIWKRQKIEYLSAEVQIEQGYNCEQMLFKELPLLLQLENDSLLYALKEINERERHVFLSRILDEKSFEVLAAELGLSYKGVAAIYYRAIAKIKKKMEEMK